MNVAFGNPKGDFDNIDYARLKRQCKNILDEYVELQAALHGVDSAVAKHYMRDFGIEAAVRFMEVHEGMPNVDQIRDSLCDIQVFAAGAQHFMGVNGDDDMAEVVGKVMTRFIKDEADKEATVAKHSALGVTDVYFEGDFPVMVMKSASDQPDAPKGKFLKSASFTEPKFIHPEAVNWLTNGSSNLESRRKAYKVLADADSIEFCVDSETEKVVLILTNGSIAIKITPEEGHVGYQA